MAFERTDAAGGQGITDISTTQIHPFGFTVTAQDPIYGFGEFVYVKGITSGAVGLVATYNLYTGVTAVGAARAKGLLGFFMSVLDANTKFGWLQIRGAAVASVGTVSAGATVYLAASGQVDDAVVAGDIVYNANFATGDGTPASTFAVVSIFHPYSGDTDNA
jgi:hypothetical protein